MLKALTVGSLFSGIGGLELGLERAGMQVRWQVEVDPFCRRVLAKHWPHVVRHEDVRDVGGRNLERVDVICGGFPCQDVSSNGNRTERKGLDGERSGLWREYARLIGELRPRYVLVENVAVLLARGVATVLGDLAASGYDAEWDCLPACAVGAPHQRDRLFLVAYPNGAGLGGQPQRDGQALQSRLLPPRWDDADGLVLAARRAEEAPAVLQRVADGVSTRLDGPRLKALGNAVHPAVAEWLGRRIVAHAERYP